VGTIFNLLDEYEDYWKRIKGSEDVPILGDFAGEEPPAFDIDVVALVDYFKLGYENFGALWRNILDPDDYAVYERLYYEDNPYKFLIPNETWVRTVYRYAITFHSMARQRFKVLNTLIPLYNLNVANLYNRLRDADQVEAEGFFEDLALTFEELKEYFVHHWEGIRSEETAGY
jgi:hypothetical protein